MTMSCQRCQVSETSGQKPGPLLKITDFDTYKANGQLHFPTELDLINLICVEKKLSYSDKCVHGKPAKEIGDYLGARGWKLLEVLAENEKNQHAAAFWNTKNSLLVIIHRGTKLTHWGSLVADKKIVAQEIGAFGFRAYDFTSRMIDSYGACSSITIAGHSLGGYLAQFATFLSKYPEKLGDLGQESVRKFWDTLDYERYNLLVGSNSTSRHLHCVSFDGPGLKGVITKIFPKYSNDREYIYKLLDSLDIEVYLCNNVNAVNAVNEQLGSIFLMKSDSIFGGSWWFDHKVGSHSSDKILEFWRGYCKGERGCQVLKVNDWKVCEGKLESISNAFSNSKEIPDFLVRNPLEFRASCFDDMERATIRNLHAWKAYYKKNQGSWDGSECIKFITGSKVSYITLHNYQVLKVKDNPSMRPLYLYRDYFIAKMKYEINEARKLVRNSQLPDYAAHVFIYITEDYLRTLPQFETSNQTVTGLEDFLSELNVSVKLDRFVIRTSEQHETRICTAKVFEILKSFDLWADPKSYLVLNTDILRELEDLYAAELKDLNYIVIECVSHFDAGVIDKWLDKFKGNSSIIVIASNKLRLSTQVSRSMVLEASDLKALYKTVRFESLNELVQFKIKGNWIRVSDLVPLGNADFWKSVDKYELFKMMQVGWIGAELPQLTSFEESYFIERTSKGGEINCMELLLDTNQQRRLVIIADEPGMGKTTIMKKLAIYKQVTKSEQVPWTIFVNLNLKHIQEIINNCNRESYTDILAKFETELCTNSLVKFLGEIHRHPNRLYVFLDGLDEINEDLRSKTLNLIDVLINETRASVFIATRTWLAYELRNRFTELKPAFYKLNAFTEKECVLFLCNYWTNHKDFIAVYEVLNRDFVTKYAEALLTKFRKVIGKEADKFIGIPFQLQMLASAFLHKPFMEFYVKYKQNTANVSSEEIEKWLPEFKNVTQLYTKFVRVKIQESLLAKCGINVDPETSRAALAACDPQEKWLEIHRMAGFDHIFGYEHRKPFASEKIVRKDQIDILHCTGIVKDYEKGEYMHRSMAEYLAADFIVYMARRTGGCPELFRFLDLNLFLKQYQNVAHFVNWLSINTTLSRPLSKMFAKITDLDTNMEAIVGYLQSEVRDTDCLGRNIMHYLFIFNSLRSRAESCKCGKMTNHTFLTAGQHLLGERDLFQATPWAYRVLRNDRALYDPVEVKTKSPLGKLTRCAVIRKLLFPYFDEMRYKMISLKDTLSQTCPGTCTQALGVDSSALTESVETMIQNSERYIVDYSIACRRNVDDFHRTNTNIMDYSDASMLEKILDSILSVGGGRSSNNVARIGFAARLITSLHNNELCKHAIQFLYAILKENDYEYYKSCIRYEIKVKEDVEILRLVPRSDYAQIFGILRASGFVNLKKEFETAHTPIRSPYLSYVYQFGRIMNHCGPDSISAEDRQEIGEIIMKWVRCVPASVWDGLDYPISIEWVWRILGFLANVVGTEKACENLQDFEQYIRIKKFMSCQNHY